MGRTTKTGKREMNPTDAYRKEQRKKEIKKNRKDRKRVRELGSWVKDPEVLRQEIEKMEKQATDGTLDRKLLHKLEENKRLYPSIVKLFQRKQRRGSAAVDDEELEEMLEEAEAGARQASAEGYAPTPAPPAPASRWDKSHEKPPAGPPGSHYGPPPGSLPPPPPGAPPPGANLPPGMLPRPPPGPPPMGAFIAGGGRGLPPPPPGPPPPRAMLPSGIPPPRSGPPPGRPPSHGLPPPPPPRPPSYGPLLPAPPSHLPPSESDPAPSPSPSARPPPRVRASADPLDPSLPSYGEYRQMPMVEHSRERSHPPPHYPPPPMATPYGPGPYPPGPYPPGPYPPAGPMMPPPPPAPPSSSSEVGPVMGPAKPAPVAKELTAFVPAALRVKRPANTPSTSKPTLMRPRTLAPVPKPSSASLGPMLGPSRPPAAAPAPIPKAAVSDSYDEFMKEISGL